MMYVSYVFVGLWDLRLFSSDAFFLRTFTYVCSIRVNERVYVFWALRAYTYVKKTQHWKTAYEFCYLYSVSKM